MRTFMLALFVALLLLVLGGLYLAFPAGVTSIRFLVVLALGVLGVISYIIYEKVRAVIGWVHWLERKIQGLPDPVSPPQTGQPPQF